MKIEETETLREKFYSFLINKTATGRQALDFLTKSNAPDEIIKSFMNEAESMGLINDEAYSRLFIEGHIYWGNAKILYELGTRGISRWIISSALENSKPESERACELASDWKNLEPRKIAARLRSRGFTNRAVSEALESLKQL